MIIDHEERNELDMICSQFRSALMICMYQHT